MICKECQSEGKKSTIREDIYSGMRTLLYCSPYYDEEGRHHNHDYNYNYTTFNFICSNNHKWTEKSYGNCWCGWSNEPK